MLKLQAQSIYRNYYIPMLGNLEIEQDDITYEKKVWTNRIGDGCIFEGFGDDIAIIRELYPTIKEDDILLRYCSRVYYCAYEGDDYQEKVDILIIDRKNYFFIYGLYKDCRIYAFKNDRTFFPTKTICGYTISEMIEEVNKMYNNIYSFVVNEYNEKYKDKQDD